MTEEEARKRWCPFARSFHAEVDDENRMVMASVNRRRDGEPDQWCRCIASSCMAWRWTRTDPVSGIFPQNTTDGFCGLAGLP